jgi:hypothetical protein
MKRVVGVILVVLGGLLALVAIPFLVHTLVNVVFVLLLGQPVPGWWWGLVGPVQDVVALPILAFAFVIPLGYPMSLIAALILTLVLLGIGLVLLWAGRRLIRRGGEGGEGREGGKGEGGREGGGR